MEVIPELPALLEAYLRKESALREMRNQLYLNLPILFPKSAEPERGLLSEILAGIYEVEDGVMPEETFRQAVQEFLAKNPVPAVPVAAAD